MDKRILSESHINTIERVLEKGDRVELIPLKDRLSVKRIRREEVKIEKSTCK